MRSSSQREGGRKYDGELFAAVDGPMALDSKPPVWYVQSGKSVDVRNLLAGAALSARHIRNAVPTPVVAWAEGVLKRRAQGVEKKIVDLLLDGRLRLTFLVNSHGGHAGVRQELGSIAQYITRQKGEVEAIVATAAESAAALLLHDASTLTALPHSRCFWHLSHDAQENAGLRREEFSAYKDFLLSHFPSSQRPPAILQRAIAAARRHPEGELILFAPQLHRWDIIQKIWRNVTCIVDEIAKRGFPLHFDQQRVAQQHTMERCLVRSLYEELLYRHCEASAYGDEITFDARGQLRRVGRQSKNVRNWWGTIRHRLPLASLLEMLQATTILHRFF